MEGKYQAYPKYRDSNGSWLGNIPSHWVAVPLKRVSSLSTGLTPPTSNEANYVDYESGLPWIRPEDLDEEGNATKASKFLSQNGWELMRIVQKNSTLICCIGTIGKAGYVHTKVSTNQQITSASFNYAPKFNYYLVQAAREVLEKTSTGNVIRILNSERLGGIPFLSVPPSEAEKIAYFLDHETAQIDTLIDKQQQLIKLLNEKRQAVISHAVTKGLNPDVSMRDSEVEWFNEVPTHWVISKFSYLSLVVRGGSPRPAGDPTLFDGSYSPWVTVAEITKNNEIYLTDTKSFLTQKGSEQCRVFSAGTLVLSNSGATLGVPKILKIDANANDGVLGFENLKINHEFIYFYLSTLTEKLREQIRNKGGSTQINLNTDIVKDISVPVPPSDEIEDIVAYVLLTIDKYKQLKEKAQIGIDLLKERRTALISATTTGKIDVRNWQAPKIKHRSETEGDNE